MPISDYIIIIKHACTFLSGLCALLDANELPPCVMDLAKQILPDFIHLFSGLKKARALREEDAEEDEDEAEIDDDEEELSELEDDQANI